MNLNKENMKKIRSLILFVALIVLAVLKFDSLYAYGWRIIGILKPFLLGGAIAFLIHIPMGFYERVLFENEWVKNSRMKSLRKAKRPLSMVLAFLSVILVVIVVAGIVIPQLAFTVQTLMEKIPIFIQEVTVWIQKIATEVPEVKEMLEKLEPAKTDWNAVMTAAIDFLRNGFGEDVLTSTFSIAETIIGNTVSFFIALVFSIYILMQKEKLGSQFSGLLKAYTPERIYRRTMKVCSLLHDNFSRFITGQCIEAVILGTLFVVSMTLFRFEYALMIGVLIAFTSLIPIVGAFIGCFVGAFLLLVDDPVRALTFVILFLVIQQIEGNLIYPHVVGNSVGLPSIWVLVAVSIGGSLMGVIGMLIFIPLMSTGYSLLREDVQYRIRKTEEKKVSAPPEKEEDKASRGKEE